MKDTMVYLFTDTAKIPTRNFETDAGLDLYSDEDTFVPFHQNKRVKTNVAIYIPKGYVGIVKDRSSMGVKGLSVMAGVIDAHYNGSVDVVLNNEACNSDFDVVEGRGYKIKKGDRIAQLLIIEAFTPELKRTMTLWSTGRGSDGFGSSGR